MSQREILQVLLPAAIDMGNLQVAARQFDLNIFANISNYYPSVSVDNVRVIPSFIPLQVHVYRNDVMLGQYEAANGIIPLSLVVTSDSSTLFRFYNLSVDTEAMVTLELSGRLYNAI